MILLNLIIKSCKFTDKKSAVSVLRSSVFACDESDVGDVMIHLNIVNQAIVSYFSIVSLSFSSDHHIATLLTFFQLFEHLLDKELSIDNLRPKRVNISQGLFIPYFFTLMYMSIQLTLILHITSQMFGFRIDLLDMRLGIKIGLFRVVLSIVIVLYRGSEQYILFLCLSQ